MSCPLPERRSMIEPDHAVLSLRRQCDLVSVHRSGLHYAPCGENTDNLAIMRFLDEQYLKTPFYGVRRMTAALAEAGFAVNEKRVRRLLRLMGLEAIYPKHNLSKPAPGHRIYPYLLRQLDVTRPGQVWAIDITYIPLAKGFLYLVAIIDVYSRYVVGWSLSNTLEATWVRDTVRAAIAEHGAPEILNSDQGSQFTAEVYINELKNNDIQISMDGKGRAIDNIFIERLWRTVKYEEVYLKPPNDGLALYEQLTRYFRFYNHERLHQSLEYRTPGSYYRAAA
jgi:putative transposase